MFTNDSINSETPLALEGLDRGSRRRAKRPYWIGQPDGINRKKARL